MFTRLHVRVTAKWNHPQGTGRHTWRRNAFRAVLDKARCLVQSTGCYKTVLSWHQALQPPCRLTCS